MFKKTCLYLNLLIVFLCLIVAVPVLAENGSGGGKNNPLSLESSLPSDGQEGVVLDTQIKLSFSKNVVNMSVKDNNLQCFKLLKGDETVEFEVQMADDQIEPEGKRDIILIPKDNLQANAEYTVVVSSELQSKSGSTLGREMKIRFKTADSASEAKAESATATSSQDEGESNGGMNTSTILIILIAAIIVIYVFMKNRKN